MTLGILGAGHVGTALGRGFAALGHDVRFGTRTPDAPHHRAFAAETGLPVTSYAEAARGADVLILATPWEGAEDAVRTVSAVVADGTPVLDATNPIDFGPAGPLVTLDGSAGERVQAWLPHAHVVKAFATVGADLMIAPDLPGGPPTMFIAGNDAGAKAVARGLIAEAGWETADLGGIEGARAIEGIAVAWIRIARATGARGHAFRVLRAAP